MKVDDEGVHRELGARWGGGVCVGREAFGAQDWLRQHQSAVWDTGVPHSFTEKSKWMYFIEHGCYPNDPFDVRSMSEGDKTALFRLLRQYETDTGHQIDISFFAQLR